MAVDTTTGNEEFEGVSPLVAVPVTIPSGQSLSPAVDLGNASIVEVGMPAAWDAAQLTFQVSADGVTWLNFYKNDGSTEYSVTVTAGIAEPPPSLQDFAGWRYWKLRSGTHSAAVNQTADRTFTLMTRPV